MLPWHRVKRSIVAGTPNVEPGVIHEKKKLATLVSSADDTTAGRPHALTTSRALATPPSGATCSNPC